MKQRVRTVQKSEFARLIGKYKPLGIVLADELGLPPDDALRFVNDLENLGVPIMGLDGGYYANQEHRDKG